MDMDSLTLYDHHNMPQHAQNEPVATETITKTSQYLDLTEDLGQPNEYQASVIDTLRSVLHHSKKIVMVTGAGISVAAGIPDFRSPDGFFQQARDEYKLKYSGKQLFDASVYKDDSSTALFHTIIREMWRVSKDAQPTAFHRMIASLATQGRLLRLYTQNIDSLENRLPPLVTKVPISEKPPWPLTIQLHGGLDKMVCQKCQHVSLFQVELFDGPTPPQCPQCARLDSIRTKEGGKRSHGIGRLRPRVVLYNEHNPDGEAIGAVITADIRQRPDAVIVVGTTLQVDAIKRMVRDFSHSVKERKVGTMIWINRDHIRLQKDLKDEFDLIVRADADQVARIVDLQEWEKIPQASTIFQEASVAEVDDLPEAEDDEPHHELLSTTTSSPPRQLPCAIQQGLQESQTSQVPFRPKRQMFLPAWQ
jgi:NAD+-dependent protein deacetylase SIR2